MTALAIENGYGRNIFADVAGGVFAERRRLFERCPKRKANLKQMFFACPDAKSGFKQNFFAPPTQKPSKNGNLMLAALFASCQSTRVQKDERSNTLIQAAKDNNATEARRLIEAGADVSAKGNDGSTALMDAARCNSPDVAKVLLAAGADVNAKTLYCETALMYAAGKNPQTLQSF